MVIDKKINCHKNCLNVSITYEKTINLTLGPTSGYKTKMLTAHLAFNLGDDG